MYPQQPQQPLTPGYGAPQPSSQQPGQYPGYMPGYPPSAQPEQPMYPGAQAPTYGQPSQYPGQYPPSNAPGYAAHSQPIYPGYPAGPTGAYAPPPQRRPRNARLPIAIGAGVLVLAIIIGLVVRYNGPTTVSRSFLQNLGNNDYSAALGQVCSTADSTQLRQGLTLAANVAQRVGVTTDTSQLSFTLVNESNSNASVSFSGPITGSNGQTRSISGTMRLNASGLWWCVVTYTLR